MDRIFERELEELINRHSKENDSDTPDFILAKYLDMCLDNFNAAIKQREEWYGRQKKLSDLKCDELLDDKSHYIHKKKIIL